MTAAVYIDGFNMYYGLGLPLDCKWVDLQKFFEHHYPDDEIRQIYFFEALIAGPHRAHQEAYIAALETLPKMRVILGEMKAKPRRCGVTACAHLGDRSWQHHEEKHTDVNIAIHMVADAFRASYDKQILVTGDTDLVPAVQMVKAVRPQQQVTLCIPALHSNRIWGAKPLGSIANKASRADAELLLRCQFPEQFVDAAGNVHQRPAFWHDAPLTAARDWRHRNPTRWLNTLPSWCR